MAYDLEIRTGKDSFFSKDIDGERPRIGDSYEIERATRREFVGDYKVIDVKDRGTIYTPTRGVFVELKNPLVTIALKK